MSKPNLGFVGKYVKLLLWQDEASWDGVYAMRQAGATLSGFIQIASSLDPLDGWLYYCDDLPAEPSSLDFASEIRALMPQFLAETLDILRIATLVFAKIITIGRRAWDWRVRFTADGGKLRRRNSENRGEVNEMKRSALLLAALFVLGAIFAAACSSQPAAPQIIEVTAEPQIVEVEVPVEVVKEVEVEKIVEREVEVVKEVEVEVEKEVVKVERIEVPVEKVVEVQKIVEKEVVVTNLRESPDLAARVAAGELPPVHERLPSQPMIIPPLGDIGQYGGKVRRFYLGPADGCNFFRLSRASLARFSQDGFSFIPSVARGWEVSEDGKEWTFFLREGMKWSDGDDFNADDFMYQYNDVILNPDLNPNPPFFLKIGSEVGSISKVDDNTVKFTFPVPNFLFLEIVAQADEACYGATRNVPWAPEHYMKQFHIKYNPDVEADAEANNFESWTQFYDAKTQYNLNPDKPTIAPWKFSNPLGDQVVESERNPYFWAVDPAGNQLPYLDSIQLTLVESTELGTLRAVQGEIDMQGRHIQLDQFTTLKTGEEDGGYTVKTWPTFAGSDVAFFFNMSLPGHTGDAIRTKEFRQALSLAIDRSSIQEIQFLGLGDIRQGVPSPGHPHYPGDDIAKLRTEYDKDGAIAMLDALSAPFGKDDSSDCDNGPCRTYNGERIEMTVTVTDAFGTWPDAAQVVGRAWEAVGVKANVNVTTRSLHFTRWQTNEWAVMVWNEDTAGFTFSSISKRAPEGIGTFHGPGCAAWLINPEGETAFECPQESLDLLEMHKRGPGLPEAERNALGKEIYKTIVENQYNIGIVGLSPMVQGVVVVNNDLNNVPDSAGNDWPLRTPNTGFPEQWYYSQ